MVDKLCETFHSVLEKVIFIKIMVEIRNFYDTLVSCSYIFLPHGYVCVSMSELPHLCMLQ